MLLFTLTGIKRRILIYGAGMKKSVKQILLLFASFIFIVIGSSAIWVLSTFQRLNMDELVYELSQPLKGTGSDMLMGYLLKAFVPAVAVTIVMVLLNVLRAEALEKIRGKIRIGTFLASLLFSLICVIVFWNRLDITEYLVNLSDTSTFIDDNYVDPKDVTISFPQEKRNLIYIFLESMEITYADKANGGGFDYNCIPELTKLAESEECFTAGSGLNGGYVLPGTSWTMGGMFAQTSGLPLKTNLANNMMDTQESFFSGATCLGDVLKKEGYNQELLIGSDAVFGGRKLYFTEHGGYDIHDYNYALENGLIPEGYHVFWGYEDEKLFENAKKDLLELSSKDEPFNLTMLTVDTHFTDGYLCHLCRDEFDTQYANVMACSSRQVTDFVNWIKQQDFYGNTTIVISGDHTTMSEQFTSRADEDYARRTYVSVINSAVEKTRTDADIEFATLDMYPTTLAAMGAEIEGNRLGLGTNLFSGEETLIEKYGLDHVTREMNKSSKLIDELGNIVLTEELLRAMRQFPDADINVVKYDSDTNTITVKVDDIVNVDGLKGVMLYLYDDNEKKLGKVKASLADDRSYMAQINLDKYGSCKVIQVMAKGKKETLLGQLDGNLTLAAHENLDYYIELFKERENLALIMAGSGNISSNANVRYIEAIKSLGIQQNLERGDISFYAVVDSPSLVYDSGSEELSMDGILIGNEVPIHVVSANEESGEYCSIMVDGVEYASDETGLHVAVYDYDKGEVIDSACFNMFDIAGTYEFCHVEADVRGDTVHLTVPYIYSSRIRQFLKISLRGELWDAKHKGKPVVFDFMRDEEQNLYADLDIKNIDTSDAYLKVYVYDEIGRKEIKDLDWHGNLALLKCDLSEYLETLYEDIDKYIVIMSVKNDALRGIDDSSASVLKAMGLADFEEDSERVAYYAIVSSEGTIEEKGKESLSYEGNIGDTEIAVESAIVDYGDYASIRIDGQEYANHYQGLNIVVYNKQTHLVEDSVSFNTVADKPATIR